MHHHDEPALVVTVTSTEWGLSNKRRAYKMTKVYVRSSTINEEPEMSVVSDSGET